MKHAQFIWKINQKTSHFYINVIIHTCDLYIYWKRRFRSEENVFYYFELEINSTLPRINIIALIVRIDFRYLYSRREGKEDFKKCKIVQHLFWKKNVVTVLFIEHVYLQSTWHILNIPF